MRRFFLRAKKVVDKTADGYYNEYMNSCSYIELGGVCFMKPLNDDLAYDLGDFFKIFGDPSRIKILYALLQKDMCVSELVGELGLNQSALSHQLRLLRQNDIVKFRRDGKMVIYSLDDEHVGILLRNGIEHLSHKNAYEGEEVSE